MECQEQGLQQQNKKNEQYEHLLRKYRERFPDADKDQLIKKFNYLRTNFRKELKRIKDSEKSGTGADDVVEPTLWYSKTCLKRTPYIPETWTNGK